MHIETTRPELIPSVVALIAHPDDERYAGPVRNHGHLTVVRGRGPGAGALPRRDGQGRRHRDVLHLRRPHRRAVVARAAAARPARSSSETAASRRRRRTGSRPGPVRTCSRELRRQDDVRRPRRGRRRPARSPATSTASPSRPSARPTSTRRATSRSRSSPRASGTSATAVATTSSTPRSSNAARRSTSTPTFMRTRYENWVGGLNGDWLISRQRFFGAPIPALVPARRRRRARVRPPDRARRGQLPVDPFADVPPGYDESPSGARPAVSSATPTSWTPGPRPRCSPQIAAGWRSDAELFDKVFPMDVRPQGHDIIRTWLFSTVVRAHFEHGSMPWTARRHQRLDPRPGPQEDEQVQGQRRDARGRRRAARRRRRALLGRLRASRHRRGLRHRSDEGRPPAGHQGAQRQQVRPLLR